MSEIFKSLLDYYSYGQEYVIYTLSIFIFFIVAAITFVLVQHSLRTREIKRRAYDPSLAAGGTGSFDPRLPRNAGLAAVSAALATTASRFAGTGSKDKSSSVIREDLIQAGFHEPSALAWYYFARVVSSLALPAIAFPIIISAGLSTPTPITIIILIVFALIGMLTPTLYIMRRKSKMAAEYRDGFPEFMDLLVVCTEAGIGLTAAIDRVTKEITKTHKNLGVNLHIMTLEMRAGRELTDAFESLADRVTIDEVRSLGSLLQQSKELGTSLVESLRVYSKEMREKRFFRAEEKAYALPAKMVIPLGLFVFPVMLIVIMLPLMIRIQVGFFS